MKTTKSKMKFRKRVKAAFRKQTERQRWDEIQGFVDFCFTLMIDDGGFSVEDVSRKTGLCLGTVYALKRGDYTTCVRASTLQKLGHAVGAKVFPKSGE